MAVEVKTLVFPNTPAGQAEKTKAIKVHLEGGWEVVSETVKDGKFKGKTACCFALLFLPCAFCAGSSDGEIYVTLQKRVDDKKD